MLIAKIQINAGAGKIFLPGEPVTGLDKETIRDFLAKGYVEDDKAAKPASSGRAKTAQSGSKPKSAPSPQPSPPGEGDEEPEVGAEGSGNAAELPPGLNPELQ